MPRASWLALAMAVSAIATGLAVLAGWHFNAATLKSVLPNFPSMKANTAVGFVMVGAALALLGRSRSPSSRRVSRILALSTVLLVLLTLSQDIFGVDLGFDQLLIADSRRAVRTLHPGRMPPATAVIFAIVASAVGLASFRRTIAASQRFALASGLMAFLPFVADLYGADASAGIKRFAQMAIHAEVAFVLLSVGVCALHPTVGIVREIVAETMGGWLLRLMVPFAIGIPLVLGWLRVHGERNGYYDSKMGTALVVVTVILILVVLIWWTASTLTKVDAIRRGAERMALARLEEVQATHCGIRDGVMTTDSNGRVMRMNPVAEQLTGWVESEAVGKSVKEVVQYVDETTPQLTDSSLAQAFRQDIASELADQMALVARDGSIRPIARSGAPIRDSDGKVCGAVLVFHDRTSERASLTAKRQADANFAEAFQCSPVPSMIASVVTNTIVDVNGAFLHVTGYDPDELIGRTPDELALYVDGTGGVRPEPAVSAPEGASNLETIIRTKDGRLRTCLWSCASIQLADEPHRLTSLVDISERKQVEEQLQQALSESRRLLSVANESRQALLSLMDDRRKEEDRRRGLEIQLAQAHKLESMGLLAGGVAHDFNNLISVILNYNGFAMNAVGNNDSLRADLAQVNRAATRAAALTQQLLAFGRKQVLQPVPLSLNRVVDGMQDMLRRILREDIRLVLAVAPDLGVTLADSGQMEQVLMNLVVNAQDAMPNGGTLTIETANLEVTEVPEKGQTAAIPGHYVQLRVTDTGHGMDKQTQSKLFDPFFSTKENGKGTGLGLATVYGIVKQSGGNIWVDSELGQGTCIKIELPRDLSAVARPTTIPPVSRQTTGSETILVVEDEDALREAAKRTLAGAGYHVLEAPDGDTALQLSMQHAQPIHLLLTDVVMPRMNGRMLAQEIAKTRPATAVLYMSGYTADAFVHRGGLDVGIHFIGKPFTAHALMLKVREVLDAPAANHAGNPEPVARLASQPPVRVLDEAAFRMLPRVMLSKLREAANSMSHDKIAELLERLRLTEPEIADVLRRRADHLDYGGLLDLLGREEKTCGSR